MKNKISSMIICVMMVGQLHAEPQEDSGESSLIESCGQGGMDACEKLASLRSSYEYSRLNPRPEPYSSWESKIHGLRHSSNPLDQYNILKLGEEEVIRRKICYSRIQDSRYGVTHLSRKELCDEASGMFWHQSSDLIKNFPDEDFDHLMSDWGGNDIASHSGFGAHFAEGRTFPFLGIVYAKLSDSQFIVQEEMERDVLFTPHNFYILDSSDFKMVMSPKVGDSIFGYAKIATTGRITVAQIGVNQVKLADAEDFQECVNKGGDIRTTQYGKGCERYGNYDIASLYTANVLIMYLQKAKTINVSKKMKKLKPSRPIKK